MQPSKLLSSAQQEELKQLFETFVYAQQQLEAAELAGKRNDSGATASDAAHPQRLQSALASSLLRYSTVNQGKTVFYPLSTSNTAVPTATTTAATSTLPGDKRSGGSGSGAEANNSASDSSAAPTDLLHVSRLCEVSSFYTSVNAQMLICM